MAEIVVMPKQGQSVESCIITELKKKTGNSVKKGEVLFSYETDKASFEEESPVDGVVLACFYDEGDEVPVLDNMMVIGEPGEDITTLLNEILKSDDKGQKEDVITETVVPDGIGDVAEELVIDSGIKSSPVGSDELFVSPRARKLAEKEAVDLSRLAGTGPQGRIIENDVLA
ncbi:MAG: E3 binding domain-containing protein, partial [Proteiniphilum sp.]